jgi:hypothetical protein
VNNVTGTTVRGQRRGLNHFIVSMCVCVYARARARTILQKEHFTYFNVALLTAKFTYLSEQAYVLD